MMKRRPLHQKFRKSVSAHTSPYLSGAAKLLNFTNRGAAGRQRRLQLVKAQGQWVETHSTGGGQMRIVYHVGGSTYVIDSTGGVENPVGEGGLTSHPIEVGLKGKTVLS